MKDKKEQKKGIYIGESSRSMHERGKEHVQAAISLNQDSHIIKHWLLEHKELEVRPPFKFRVLGTFRDCLSRQLTEAVKIDSGVSTLNSKKEWGHNSVPRLQVAQEDFQVKRKMLELDMKEKEEERELMEFVASIKKKEMDPNRNVGGVELDLEDTDSDTMEDVPDMPSNAWDWLDEVIKQRKESKELKKEQDREALKEEERLAIQVVVEDHIRREELEVLARDIILGSFWTDLDIIERDNRVRRNLEAKEDLLKRIRERKARLEVKKRKEQEFRRDQTVKGLIETVLDHTAGVDMARELNRVTSSTMEILSTVLDRAMVICFRRALDTTMARELLPQTPIVATRSLWQTGLRRRRRGEKEKVVQVVTTARDRLPMPNLDIIMEWDSPGVLDELDDDDLASMDTSTHAGTITANPEELLGDVLDTIFHPGHCPTPLNITIAASMEELHILHISPFFSIFKI